MDEVLDAFEAATSLEDAATQQACSAASASDSLQSPSPPPGVENDVDIKHAPCASAAAAARLRHRIEHVQHVSGPAVAARFAALGVTAVPNPLHLLSDRHMVAARLGEERAGPECSFPFASLRGASANMAFSSDWCAGLLPFVTFVFF